MSYCPFAKGDCVDGCVMRIDDECGIALFIKNDLSNKSETEYDENENMIDDDLVQKEAEKIFLEQDLDVVVQELLNFTKENQSGTDSFVDQFDILPEFWKSKKLNDVFAPGRVLNKMAKVQESANKILENELLEKEKKELPDLIKKLCEWAVGKGLNTVKKDQVSVFLRDIDKDISNDSERTLRVEANILLKKNK